MRTLCTSLGSWDTIETQHKRRHGMTFPLVILSATMRDAGLGEPDCWEGDEPPERPPGGWQVLLVSAMDSRHFWRLPRWLDLLGVPRLSSEREEGHPIVVMGGQAATAPAPVEALVDVVYIGEAEAHAPELLRTIERGRAAGWSRGRILEQCAAVPGCLVPACMPEGHVVEQVYAEDIGVTLREVLGTGTVRAIRRIEVARGCASKCGFCALGWRSKYRENSAEDIEAAISTAAAAGVTEVHLTAGDTEGHSEIAALRQAVRDHGVRDYAWNGRLDTLANDCSTNAGRYFATGLEGASHRLRAALGKPRLTDAYVVAKMAEYYDAGGRRAMWHLIGGVPGETDDDADQFGGLLDQVDAIAPPGTVLDIGRQPFGPLPHTPMQWFAPGLDTSRLGRVVASRQRRGNIRLGDKAGQRLDKALANTLVMRGGREVLPAILEGPPSLRSGREMLDYMTYCRRYGLDPRRYLGAWEVSEPTPWEHIRSAYDRSSLERAHARIARMLA